MAEETKLVVELRERLGSAECRRLRKEGMVPGNVYGHGEGPLSIKVPEEQVTPLIMAGHRVVDIDLNGNLQKTMFQDVQWDTFSRYVQHFDLLRIDANERITVDVPIELRGTAPGTLAGGVLDQPLYSIELECLPHQVPDSLELKILEMQIGDSLHISDLELPEGTITTLPADTTVVSINEAMTEEELDEQEGLSGPAEPEVIGRSSDDDGDSED